MEKTVISVKLKNIATRIMAHTAQKQTISTLPLVHSISIQSRLGRPSNAPVTPLIRGLAYMPPCKKASWHSRKEPFCKTCETLPLAVV